MWQDSASVGDFSLDGVLAVVFEVSQSELENHKFNYFLLLSESLSVTMATISGCLR